MDQKPYASCNGCLWSLAVNRCNGKARSVGKSRRQSFSRWFVSILSFPSIYFLTFTFRDYSVKFPFAFARITDVSIWIHQVLQGYQDRHGNPKPNAHLLGLFHRICKLLHFKIKPVFVFDGGVPMLKRNTIALRRKQKSIATSKAVKMKTDLINNLIKHNAVMTVLNPEGPNVKNIPSHTISTVQNKPSTSDMFILPSMAGTSKLDTSDSENSDTSADVSPRKQTKWVGNIHSVDVTSAEFKALPADVRYDILTDLKETRKQSSWGRLHEMPEESHHFSGFQMKRLLKRRLVQESLESAEKEMGGKSLTLGELDKLLTEQGISTKGRDVAYRIAADSTTRLIYISDKSRMADSRTDNATSDRTDINDSSTKDEELVADLGTSLPIAEDMSEYELNDYPDSEVELLSADQPFSFVEDSSRDSGDYGDGGVGDTQSDSTLLNESRPISKKYFGKNVMNPALTYMLEHSDLTQEEILKLLEQNKKENTNRGKIAAAEGSQKRANDTSKTEEISLRESVSDPALTDTAITNVTDTNGAPIAKEIVEDSLSSVTIRALTSESESDSTSDFVEISEVPRPTGLDTASPAQPPVPAAEIEITIRPNILPEDDLFANVFDSFTGSSVEPKPIVDTSSSRSHIDSTNVNDDQISHPIPSNCHVPTEEISERLSANLATDEQRMTNAESAVPFSAIETKLRGEEETVDTKKDPERKKSNATEDREKLQSWIEQIKTASSAPPPVSERELLSLQTQLEDEQGELTANIGKLERQATGISDQIRVEAQELLRLFGIPYVVAPMEAEAQCAYLEQIKLTDGTITDDSDIWLFGGKSVYKNFFNHSKQVVRFRASDIEYHFKLTRAELIQLALLVGSDYTEGLTGIGPVTALEILAAFPPVGENLLHGLTSFSSWIKSGKTPGPGKTALRSKLKNVQVHEGFPSQAVVQAYLCPAVDESKESFTWGKPNMVLLADYAARKFGWAKSKFDEQMKLILNRVNGPKSQRAIDLYFKVEETPKCIEKNLSKRVQIAVKRLNHNNESENEGNDGNDGNGTTEQRNKKCKRKPRARKASTVVNVANHSAQDTPDAEKKEELTKILSWGSSNTEECIPQREKDKAAALQRKLRAIEVLRKSKQGLYKTKKVKRCVRKVKQEAELSESDSTD